MGKRPWMCACCGWRWFLCTCPVATADGGTLAQDLDGKLRWHRADGSLRLYDASGALYAILGPEVVDLFGERP